MKFCTKCGVENQDGSSFCTKCGTPLLSTDTTSKSNKKRIIVYTSTIIFLIIIFAILFSTHIICINHNFLPATCLSPQTCEYCGKTDGEPTEHNWMQATCKNPKRCINCGETIDEPTEHKWKDATCDMPKTCSYCKKTEGVPLGHSGGEWVVTKEATLVHSGKNELMCTICSKAIDSKDVEKKTPKVNGKSFNFTDSEFIEWLESKSAIEFELMDTDKQNTLYRMTNTNTDETGLMLLNHRKNDLDGEICLIAMHMYNDNVEAMVLVTYIGELIDSSFSGDDGFEELYFDRTYIKAKMTSTMLELLDDIDFAVLTPTTYLEYILS